MKNAMIVKCHPLFIQPIKMRSKSWPAKEAEYKSVQEENKQKEQIKALEEQHKKELEIERFELERLRAQRDVEAAPARLEAEKYK